MVEAGGDGAGGVGAPELPFLEVLRRMPTDCLYLELSVYRRKRGIRVMSPYRTTEGHAGPDEPFDPPPRTPRHHFCTVRPARVRCALTRGTSKPWQRRDWTPTILPRPVARPGTQAARRDTPEALAAVPRRGAPDRALKGPYVPDGCRPFGSRPAGDVRHPSQSCCPWVRRSDPPHHTNPAFRACGRSTARNFMVRESGCCCLHGAEDSLLKEHAPAARSGSGGVHFQALAISPSSAFEAREGCFGKTRTV